MVSRETSPIREAIKAALDEHRTVRFLSLADEDGLINHLVEAVERVSVVVTIRDLDMADSENIVTLKDREAQIYLRNLVGAAVAEYADLHLTVDLGYLKVKIGDFTWSVPIPTEVYAG